MAQDSERGPYDPDPEKEMMNDLMRQAWQVTREIEALKNDRANLQREVSQLMQMRNILQSGNDVGPGAFGFGGTGMGGFGHGQAPQSDSWFMHSTLNVPTGPPSSAQPSPRPSDSDLDPLADPMMALVPSPQPSEPAKSAWRTIDPRERGPKRRAAKGGARGGASAAGEGSPTPSAGIARSHTPPIPQMHGMPMPMGMGVHSMGPMGSMPMAPSGSQNGHGMMGGGMGMGMGMGMGVGIGTEPPGWANWAPNPRFAPPPRPTPPPAARAPPKVEGLFGPE